MPPPRRYTFTKSHRVRSRVEFSAVFDAKVRHSRGPLTAYAVPTDHKTARLGLSVSRRVGTAPRRNRIKRLLRESFRLLQHDFPRPYDLVIVVRPHEPLLLAEYQRLLTALMVKLHQAWQQRERAATPPAAPPRPLPPRQSDSPGADNRAS
jgi:ribonuclease P protein component